MIPYCTIYLFWNLFYLLSFSRGFLHLNFTVSICFPPAIAILLLRRFTSFVFLLILTYCSVISLLIIVFFFIFMFSCAILVTWNFISLFSSIIFIKVSIYYLKDNSTSWNGSGFWAITFSHWSWWDLMCLPHCINYVLNGNFCVCVFPQGNSHLSIAFWVSCQFSFPVSFYCFWFVNLWPTVNYY